MKTVVGFSARDSATLAIIFSFVPAERREREKEREREREREREGSNGGKYGTAVAKRISVLLRAENTGDYLRAIVNRAG